MNTTFKKHLIHKSCILFIAGIVLLFSFGIAMANWKVEKRATARGNNKNHLQIDQKPNGSVQILLVLRSEEKGAFDSQLPLYKVDENKVHDFKTVKIIKIRTNRWIRWEIWDGNGKPSKELLELMNGKQVVFQYYLSDGTIKEMVFPLKGAKEAIEEVIR